MKHKRRTTDAAIAANRENSKLSRGPRTDRGKENSSHNSLRHGILARKVRLPTHEDREVYRKIVEAWKTYYEPHGTLERFLVDDISFTSWKLGIVEAAEAQELSRRQESLDESDVDFGFNSEIKLPIKEWELPVKRGWSCERIVVRAVSGDENNDWDGAKTPAVVGGRVLPQCKVSKDSNTRQAKHLELEAVLGNTLENLTRYRSALKRDLYRTIQVLESLREKRKQNNDDDQTSDSERD